MKHNFLRLLPLLACFLPLLLTAQPVNDDPCGAIELTVSDDVTCIPTEPLNWVGATATPGLPTPGCGSYTTGDVWFKFTLAAPADIFITTAAGGIDDGGMALYYANACDGTLYKLDCDDDDGAGDMPQIQLFSQPTGQYFIRFWDYNDQTTTGFGGICVAAKTIVSMTANDDPCTAIELPVTPDTACIPANPVSWQTATASPGLPLPDCGSYSTGDVWFKFTLTETSDLLIRTLAGVDTNAIIDGAMALYSATSCDGTLTKIACDDDAGAGSMPQIQQFVLAAGDYFIRFWDYGDHTSGNIGGICVAAVPTVSTAPNDICAAALPFPTILLDGSCSSVAVNTAGATGLPQVNCGGGIADDDVWYSFVVPMGINKLAFHITQGDSAVAQGIRIYFSACDQLGVGTCFAASEGIFQNLGPGQTYYLRTYTLGAGTSAAYEICLQALIPPVNDNPCEAIELTPVDNSTTCVPQNPFAWQFATATAGLTNPACGSYSTGDVWFRFELTYKADIVIKTAAGSGPGAIIDGAIALYRSGTDCNDLTLLACNDDEADGVLMPAIKEFALQPGIYYLRFWDYYDVISGNIGGICIAAQPSISTAANDLCSDALPFPAIPTDGSCAKVHVNNAGATGSPNAPGGTGVDDDLWYSFIVPPGVSSLLYDITTNFGNGQHVVCLLGSCNFADLVACFYDDNESGRFDDLASGQTYWLRVYTPELNVSSDFDICLRTPPPPPANDECAGAIPFPVIPANGSCATVTVNTTWATTSGTFQCAGAQHDLWYTFVVPDNVTELVAQILASPISQEQEGFEVFTGDCGNLVSVACISDYFFESLRLKNLTPGQTYYLRAFTDSENVLEFGLCLQVPPPHPANDECAAAIAFPAIPTDGSCVTLIANTTGADGDNSDACNFIFDDDVWYSFTVPAGYASIELSSTPVSGAISAAVAVYGGNCDSLELLGCQGYIPVIIPNLIAGETYWLRAYSLFTNVASAFEICLRVPPPPPVNDECPEAIAFPNIPLNGDWVYASGTTRSATPSGQPDCNGTADDDVWYKFTVPAGQDRLLLDYGDSYDVVLELYGGQCDSLEFMNCYGSSNSTGDLRPLVAGATYYLRAYTLEALEYATFTVGLSVPQVPVNDFCAQAISFPPLPTDGSCVSISANTTLATDDDVEACYGTSDDDVWFRFTVPAPYSAVIFDLTTNFGNTAQLDVFRGTCDSLVLQECYFFPDHEDISGLEPGQTYWIRVFSSSSAGESTDFTLCLSLPPLPPPNDECVHPFSITGAPGVFVDPGLQTTAGATVSEPPICYQVSGNPGGPYDVWYSFVTDADGGDAEITLTFGDPFQYPFSFTNLVAQAFEGTCDDLTTLACNENEFLGFGLADSFVVLNFYGLSGNTTYYFRVYSRTTSGNYAEVDFTIKAVGTALSPTIGTDETEDATAPGIVKVYPSPTTTQVTVQFDAGGAGTAWLYVLDGLGRIVQQREVDALPGLNQATLSIQALPAGLYTLWLDNGAGRSTPGRFVKQ